jgi:DNA-binding transcriptional ArsR family regulator
MSLFSDMKVTEADRVWKALADITRRSILDLLADGPATTGEVCSHFAAKSRGGLCRTAVMKHLDLLVEAQLVLVRREGRLRWNHLNPVPIQQVCERWVQRHARPLASGLLSLRRHVEGGPGSPGPRKRTGRKDHKGG